MDLSKGPSTTSLTHPPVEQSATTSPGTLPPGRNPERLVLSEDKLRKEGTLTEGGNIDVTAHRPNPNGDNQLERDTPDLMSYNNDAHANEDMSLNSPGDSFSDPSNYSTLDSATSSSQSDVNEGQRTEVNSDPKKVFILHFTADDDRDTQDLICKFASRLTQLNVDVTLDLFIKDEFTGNWNIWHEKKLKESDFVLCLITKEFTNHLTGEHAGVKGNATYNLMDAHSHAFIPVFLCSEKRINYIPTCIQGSSNFFISYFDLSRDVKDSSEDFQTLYSILTSQNRRKKPERGQKVILAFKENSSKFADLMANSNPVKSVRTHNKMFMQLAMNMTAEWEPVGRMLGIGEPKLYSIKRDFPHSVEEQAVQMFQQWLMKNGSRASLGSLATAVYDSGTQYRNLLDIIRKYV